MELQFATLSGGQVVCPLPSDATGEAAELIDAAATSLASEYRQRRLAKAEPTKWLRPLAYVLISACLDNDLQHLLYRRSLATPHYKRGYTQSPNPFQLGLMAIFSEDEYFTKNERHELGKVLWYAYRHYVPTCFINGFASQVGAVAKERSDNAVEPEFAEWIIRERILDLRSNNPRTNYPDHIERRVKEFRSESAGVLGPIFQALSELQPPEADEQHDC